mmetsp:Transcript_19564/g.52761  ORF Transcript_19564/g.52761 Transcript_19564/m.52761 type:complete len:149 (+) Transcript_19564:3-449(+)
MGTYVTSTFRGMPLTTYFKGDPKPHFNVTKLLDLGLHAEAEERYRHTLERKDVELGPLHPSTLWTVHNYAPLLFSLGRQGEGLDLARRAVDGFTQVFGADHPHTLAATEMLEGMLAAQQAAAPPAPEEAEQVAAKQEPVMESELVPAE